MKRYLAITIDVDRPAFVEGVCDDEIADILRKLADTLEWVEVVRAIEGTQPLLDKQGRQVGTYKLVTMED